MELFNKNGHLTTYAINKLILGEASEMQRLEISEHLSYCNECMNLYLSALTQDVLIAPAKQFAQGVTKCLRKKAFKVIVLRYGAVAAAACMAVLMWGAGKFVFGGNFKPQPIGQNAANINYSPQAIFAEQTEIFLESIFNVEQNIFENKTTKPPPPPKPLKITPPKPPDTNIMLSWYTQNMQE
jgi:hypothetical protein